MSNLAPAVGIGIRVVTLLADQSEPIGVSEIARRLELNKNMVFRVLNSLEEEGWVSVDDNAKYRLTLVPFTVAGKAISHLSVTAAALPRLRALWDKIGESTYFGIRREDEILYLSHFDSTRAVRVAGVVGESYPLYCTAPGKAVLAFSEEAAIEDYLRRGRANGLFVPHTAHTVTDPDLLRAELLTTRERGYAIDREELSDGIVCISAPVFDYQHRVVGAIGCSCTTFYVSAEEMCERYRDDILAAARAISREMGCDRA